jgi:hypothetical protein
MIYMNIKNKNQISNFIFQNIFESIIFLNFFERAIN